MKADILIGVCVLCFYVFISPTSEFYEMCEHQYGLLYTQTACSVVKVQGRIPVLAYISFHLTGKVSVF